MKRYFAYRFKKSLPFLALATVFTVLAYVLPVALYDYTYWNGLPHTLPGTYVELHINKLLFAFMVLSAAAPFPFLYYKTNRRSADMYYSLPITRRKMLFVQYACGFLCVLCAYTAAFALGLIVTVCKAEGLNLIYYLWVYLGSLLPAYFLYSLVCFAITRANSFADGLIIAAAFYFAPAAAVCFFNAFIPQISGNALCFQLGEPMLLASRLADGIYGKPYKFVSLSNPASANFATEACRLAGSVTVALMSAGATAVMFATEKNLKAENCGQVSETAFGYKTLIPLYLIGICGVIYEIWVVLIIAFAAFAVTVLWKRTVKIGAKQAILFAVYVAAAVIVSLVANHFAT